MSAGAVLFVKYAINMYDYAKMMSKYVIKWNNNSFFATIMKGLFEREEIS